MDDLSSNEQLLSRYLLGQLSEADQTAVEERFLGDDDYYQQLLVIEDELRCAYAKGSLPPAERKQFEKRFLIFPDERQRVEVARAMIGELSAVGVETPSPAPAVRRHVKGWRERLRELGIFRSPALAFTMAAVLIIALGIFSWLAFENTRLRNQISQLAAQQSEREHATERQSSEERARLEQLNRQLEEERSNRELLEAELARREAPAADRAAPAIVSLILAPGLVRSGGETNRLTIQQDSAQIRLLLKLGDNVGHRSYQAVILNSEGARVWSRTGLNAGRQLVVLAIPARLLAQDDYEINLTGLTPAGERERVGEYYFTVLKK